MRTLAIVPCSSEKAWDIDPSGVVADRLPMREAYVGTYHRRAMRYAELVAGEVYILSALHGLQEPEYRTGNYNVTWGDPDAIGKTALREQAYSLLQRPRALDTRVIVIAGARYVARVRDAFCGRIGVVIDDVLQQQPGLRGIGDQLRWLNQQIALLSTGRVQ